MDIPEVTQGNPPGGERVKPMPEKCPDCRTLVMVVENLADEHGDVCPAHKLLDAAEVPRLVDGERLTVRGRVDWLRSRLRPSSYDEKGAPNPHLSN